MQIDRKQMKRNARLAMGEHRPSIYLISLVFVLTYTVLDILTLKLSYPGVGLADIYTMDPLYLFMAYERRTVFARILVLAISIMTSALSLGFTGVCLNVSRRMAAGFADLLDAFGFLLKVIWLHIVMAFFIFLWSLLLIVPGIVAAYRYSMAFYVLLDDPGKSAMDCIRESKGMTMGHEGELFVLHLSFLGWAMLSVIPFVSVFTIPYMEVTTANYYNALSGYRPQPDPALDVPQDEPRDDNWWS